MPGEKGGQDMFGAYEIVPNWPKPITELPGHDKWTWGAGQSVFAESPNRVFILQRGELPNIAAAEDDQAAAARPEHRVPDRPAAVARCDVDQPARARSKRGRQGRRRFRRRQGRRRLPLGALHRRRRRATATSSRTGRSGTRCCGGRTRSTSARTIRRSTSGSSTTTGTRFSSSRNDGKQLLQTIGEPNVHAADDKHFYRPTFIAWLPDGTFFVADGYANTRVVKFDKNGKYLMAWGEKGERHGAEAGDAPGLLQQRPRHRRRSADAAGVRQRSAATTASRCSTRTASSSASGASARRRRTSTCSSSTADRYLWAADRGTSKMLKYDLDGNFQYSWGTWGDFPGGIWGVHGLSVDQEGQLLRRRSRQRPRAEVSGRAPARTRRSCSRSCQPAKGRVVQSQVQIQVADPRSLQFLEVWDLRIWDLS